MSQPYAAHPQPRRAIVLGASIAGLLAARVLDDYFDEVVVMERDDLPAGPAPRRGTPHAVHPHGLLARGREVIESLFPGFTQALLDRGAVSGDLGLNIDFMADGRVFAKQRAGHQGVGASRLAIEAELRRRVMALPHVRVMTGIDVLEPVHHDGRVVGVRWVPRGTTPSATTGADLVVDCTGRGSRLPQWLERWGYRPADEERVDIGLVYASATFERDPDIVPSITAAICSATPDNPRPGVLIVQEPDVHGRGRWVAGVGGYRGDHPMCSRQGFLERARQVGHRDIIALAESGRMLDDVIRYAFPHSLRRRYEKLRRFPEGLLAMGDALTSFNPIYGQGMTVAACEAAALSHVLKHGEAQLARRFFREAAKAIDVPWQLAVGADLALPNVTGPRPLRVRLINAYVARLRRAAVHDATVATAFMRVVHLLERPPSLFAPHVVWRVLRQGGARRAARSIDHEVSRGIDREVSRGIDGEVSRGAPRHAA